MTHRKLRILIVDDEQRALDHHQKMVDHAIKNDAKAEFTLASDGYRCLELLHEQEADFHLIMLDILMPGKTGAEVIDELQPRWLEKTVVVTAREKDYAELFKKWVQQKRVRDVWVKPINPDMVRKTLEGMGLIVPKLLTRQELNNFGLNNVVGESEVLRRVLTRTQRLAANELPIHISGESGVGKELIAAAIHRFSKRNQHGMIMIKTNSALIPPRIYAGYGAKIYLFGCRQDPQLSPHGRTIGLFERAHQSSLFLDEVGKVEHDAVSMLLRVLDERIIHRVGEDGIDTPADFRLISAANEDLSRPEKFPYDFYRRLSSGGIIEVPPLRKRKQDISLLASHFLSKFAEKSGFGSAPALTSGAVDELEKYDWPANIGELEGVIGRIVCSKGEGGRITRDDVKEELSYQKPVQNAKPISANSISNKDTLREKYFKLVEEIETSTIEDFYSLFNQIFNSLEKTSMEVEEIDVPTIGSFLKPNSKDYWMRGQFQKIGKHFEIQGFGIKKLIQHYEKSKIEYYRPEDQE